MWLTKLKDLAWDIVGYLSLAVIGTVLFLIASLHQGCATTAGVTIPCPKDPVMEKVVVKEGRIEGESVSAVVDNHLALWAHIRALKSLGCRSK